MLHLQSVTVDALLNLGLRRIELALDKTPYPQRFERFCVIALAGIDSRPLLPS